MLSSSEIFLVYNLDWGYLHKMPGYLLEVLTKQLSLFIKNKKKRIATRKWHYIDSFTLDFEGQDDLNSAVHLLDVLHDTYQEVLTKKEVLNESDDITDKITSVLKRIDQLDIYDHMIQEHKQNNEDSP